MKAQRLTWNGRDPGELASRLRRSASPPAGLAKKVAAIIERVRAEGDAALLELSVELDGSERMPETLRVPLEAAQAAYDSLDPALLAAFRVAAHNIRAVSEAELHPPVKVDLPEGHAVEVLERPVVSAGIYAPGGRAAYPSSVLMGLIPARVAGVGRIVLATPPGPDGLPSQAVLAAAHLAGAGEIYAIGGAQAVAALAVGTASIEPVHVIAGPGNPWVTEAKRQLYGRVGVDGLAGPSELIVVADADADPREIALDALAQAEHGADTPIVIASDAAVLLDAVAGLIEELAGKRSSVSEAPATLVRTPTLDHALHLADAFAPEHLELRFAGAAERASARIAGCVFVGDGGATAFGDYTAGSNHVLPTGGAARFSGPLGAAAFRRRMSVVTVPADAAARLADPTDVMAGAEGLPVHGESAAIRAGQTS